MQTLPAVNAGLNALCTVLLVAGFIAVKNRRVLLHKSLMIAAFATSTIFLACYLYFHFVVKGGQPTKFTAVGPPRILYVIVLLSHTTLAALIAVLAPWTLILGLSGNVKKHKKMARWTLPIWLYVSVTGVVVYLMLYHLYPPS